MATIFTKIIKGELPCYKIHEDELTISFLALDQVHLGHTLVLPKAEISHWYEVPEKDYLQVAKMPRSLHERSKNQPSARASAPSWQVLKYPIIIFT